MKQLRLFFFTVALIFLFTSCANQPSEVYFDRAEYTLTVGQNITLSPQFNFPSSSPEPEDLLVTYASEDITIATVSDDGEVTAVGVGTTVIHATVNDIKATVQILVQ